jgi:hypothetical protein
MSNWNQPTQGWYQPPQQMYASAEARPEQGTGGNNPYGSTGTVKCAECRRRRKQVWPFLCQVDGSVYSMPIIRLCHATTARQILQRLRFVTKNLRPTQQTNKPLLLNRTPVVIESTITSKPMNVPTPLQPWRTFSRISTLVLGINKWRRRYNNRRYNRPWHNPW